MIKIGQILERKGSIDHTTYIRVKSILKGRIRCQLLYCTEDAIRTNEVIFPTEYVLKGNEKLAIPKFELSTLSSAKFEMMYNMHHTNEE